jgi:FMN reductase
MTPSVEEVRAGKGGTRPLILGIGGTTRPNSTSESALNVCLRAAEAKGAVTELISGPDLALPLYSPDTSARNDGAKALVDAFRRCDGIIIASPAYHGSVSGLVKNALDYVEDLRNDPRVYFDGLPIGLVACGAGWQAAVSTLHALRTIAHALRGWPTPLGSAINSTGSIFDHNGNCIDDKCANQLQEIGRQVVRFSRMSSASC